MSAYPHRAIGSLVRTRSLRLCVLALLSGAILIPSAPVGGFRIEGPTVNQNLLFFLLPPTAVPETNPPVPPSPPNSRMGVFLHWDLREFPDCRVPYSYFNGTGDIAGLAEFTAIDNAFATWQAESPSIITFQRVLPGAGAGCPLTVDNHNMIGWNNGVCGAPGDDIWLVPAANQVCGAMVGANVPIIGPGADGWLITIANTCAGAGNDDTYVGGNITAGPNGRVDSVPNSAFPANLFALSMSFHNVTSGRILESDIMFNDTWMWTNVAHGAAMVGTPDVRSIATHEIGHFIGLHHVNQQPGLWANSPGPIMGPFFNVNPVDDVWLVPAVSRVCGAAVGAGANIIGPGANGTLETFPNSCRWCGDDTGAFGGGGNITAGPNGVVETIPANRGANHLLANDDKDGINFLYTPDLGDAPDPWVATFNEYQSLVHSSNPSRMLNGRQLFDPAKGPWHMYHWNATDSCNGAIRFEWLGPNMDDHPLECESRQVDADLFDDGVVAPNPLIRGANNRITVTITHSAQVGRYIAGDPERLLYFNGYLDFDNNCVFDPGDREIWWSGTPAVPAGPGGAPAAVPCATVASSPNLVAPMPPASCTATTVTLNFDVAVPDGAAEDFYCRYRLDFGEDEGRVQNISGEGGAFAGGLAPAEGGAQFGEVEDYACSTTKESFDVVSGIDLWITPGSGLSFQDFTGTPIPADFFDPGSDVFTSVVTWVGDPFGLGDPLLFPADTIVDRPIDGVFPACGGSDTIPIEIVGLSLVSTSPITVTYNNGNPAEQWDVRVCLSDHPQTPGTMTIRAECSAGGTFDTFLPVQPKFIFTRQGDGMQRTLDTGAPPAQPPITFTATSGWVRNPDPLFGVIFVPPGAMVDANCDGILEPPLQGTSAFFPGIFPVPCNCTNPPPTQRNRMTVEESMWANHGVFIGKEESADEDEDGTHDVADNCPGLPNPDQADTDHDTVGDACDGCPDAPDPLQEDSDGDGTNDACDNCPQIPNPTQGDSDSDGVGNECDGCRDDPNKSDPGQCGCFVPDDDSDGDGLADCIDPCPLDSDNDADGDGVCADVDNCPNVPNADQSDVDADTVGDACDECPNEPKLSFPSEPGVEVTCDDLVDNDCDGDTDEADVDCAAPECPFNCGDINGSGGNVNLVDFASFSVCFGILPTVSQACACSDMNGDGSINLLDFATFLLVFNTTPTSAPPNCSP